MLRKGEVGGAEAVQVESGGPSRGGPCGTHGADGTAGTQKAFTYFVVLPGKGVSMLTVFLQSHPGEHERPQCVTYPISAAGPGP